MQCRRNVNSLNRALVMDLYTIHWAIPSKTKPQTKQTKQKAHKTNRKPKPQSTEKWDHCQLWGISCTMTSCVLSWLWPPKMKQNNNNTQRGHTKGWKKQQSSTRKPGIPPVRIPEITESSHSGITFTLAFRSKQRRRRVATRVVKN